jgi:D-cysteine desulfhydrase
MENLFGRRVAYEAPTWLIQEGGVSKEHVPSHKRALGRFPTPLHSIVLPELSEVELFIKRDDLSSFDLTGNKVRKLEFLLEECMRAGHDSVITAGGVQSNHARATAVAARQLGIEPHLILRHPVGKRGDETDIGLTGNLLLDRMVGAHIHVVSTPLYNEHGSMYLCEKLADQLRSLEPPRNPYIIPVGGSNALGALGYTECVREIIDHGVEFDHVSFFCKASLITLAVFEDSAIIIESEIGL